MPKISVRIILFEIAFKICLVYHTSVCQEAQSNNQTILLSEVIITSFSRIQMKIQAEQN